MFTRKVYTDVTYLACARKLLAAPDAVYPQFATHNAQTLAAVLRLRRPGLLRGQYEFQCLHGMGEPLYEQVVGAREGKLDRPCRIYAPVGTHETLLAYLVRRLLENGANTSFVNRIADASVPLDDLVADPGATVERSPRAKARSARRIRRSPLPRELYGADARQLARPRSRRRATPAPTLASGAGRRAPRRPGAPCRCSGAQDERRPRAGAATRPIAATSSATCAMRAPTTSQAALDRGDRAAPRWAAIPPAERAAMLDAPPTCSKRDTER